MQPTYCTPLLCRCWQTSERRRRPSLHAAAEPDAQWGTGQAAAEEEDKEEDKQEWGKAPAEGEEEAPEYSEEELHQRLQDQGFSEVRAHDRVLACRLSLYI